MRVTSPRAHVPSGSVRERQGLVSKSHYRRYALSLEHDGKEPIQAKLDALKERATSARKDREFAQSESEATKAREDRIKKNCEIARENVRILKNSARVQDKAKLAPILQAAVMYHHSAGTEAETWAVGFLIQAANT